MQTVTKLMKQRHHIVVSQKRRLIAHRRDEVARQKSGRVLDLAIFKTPSADAVCHPGAAAFVGAGEKVEIKAAPHAAVFV